MPAQIMYHALYLFYGEPVLAQAACKVGMSAYYLCTLVPSLAIGITNGACMGLQCTKLPRQYGGCCMGLQVARLPRQWGVLGIAPLFLFDHGV